METAGKTRKFDADRIWSAVLVLDALVTCSSVALLVAWSTQNQIDPADPGPVLPQPSDGWLIGSAVFLLATLVGTGHAMLARTSDPHTVRGGRAVAVLRLTLLLLLWRAFAA
ncbi:hypothetical protein [Streptomyces sp. NPDC048489]|uniref:hypothetical protein n=1 Tax=Streptomyces sp. NPDC048489 TaxID=3154504 RepID=UPI00343E4D35